MSCVIYRAGLCSRSIVDIKAYDILIICQAIRLGRFRAARGTTSNYLSVAMGQQNVIVVMFVRISVCKLCVADEYTLIAEYLHAETLESRRQWYRWL